MLAAPRRLQGRPRPAVRPDDQEPIAAVLIVVALTAEGPRFGPPGYELDLFYLACLAALVLGGPGPLSLDAVVAPVGAGRSSHNHRQR